MQSRTRLEAPYRLHINLNEHFQTILKLKALSDFYSSLGVTCCCIYLAKCDVCEGGNGQMVRINTAADQDNNVLFFLHSLYQPLIWILWWNTQGTWFFCPKCTRNRTRLRRVSCTLTRLKRCRAGVSLCRNYRSISRLPQLFPFLDWGYLKCRGSVVFRTHVSRNHSADKIESRLCYETPATFMLQKHYPASIVQLGHPVLIKLLSYLARSLHRNLSVLELSAPLFLLTVLLLVMMAGLVLDSRKHLQNHFWVTHLNSAGLETSAFMINFLFLLGKNHP